MLTAVPSTAGVENGNECYCGSNIVQAYPVKDSDGRVACAGDGSQYCGGTSRLMVYIKVLICHKSHYIPDD